MLWYNLIYWYSDNDNDIMIWYCEIIWYRDGNIMMW